MKRVLITGAGGFLGGHLLEAAPRDVDLYATTFCSAVPLSQDHIFKADLTDMSGILRMLEKVRPEVILHCAAVSSEKAVRDHPERAFAINVSATRKLAAWSADAGCRLIFTSTDLVFDGLHAPYREEDMPRPTMEYGKTKYEAEQHLLGQEHCLLLRLPLMYGWGRSDRIGMMSGFEDQLRVSGSARLFTDEWRTPAWAGDVAAFMWVLATSGRSGLLHLGGRERVSRMELGQLMKDHLGIREGRLLPVTRKDADMSYRPADTSLDSSAAYALGYRPAVIADKLTTLRNGITGGLS